MLEAEAHGDSLRLFYSYSHRDETLRDELAKHLSQLRHAGLIAEWHDRQIRGGADWAGKIDLHLEQADIILLLVSPDFLASDYCYDVEMRRALVRHRAGEARVVPIVLRPVDWHGAPFASLQILPTDARPITSWPSVDDGFLDVARSLRQLIAGRQDEAARERQRPVESESRERVVDAAIARTVQVGRTTDLVAMVRTEESDGLKAILSIEPDYSAAPEDVRSQPFTMEFPVAADGRLLPVPLALRLESADFEPPMQEKRISVPPDRDSETCVFLLKPVRAGALKLLLDVRYGDLLAASRLLRTESAAEVLPAGMPDYVLASVPLASAARMEERLEVKRSETSSRPSPSFEHVEPRASTRPAPVPSRKASRTVRWAMSGGGLAAVVFLAALSLWNLQPSMDSPAALDTTTLTIRANVPEVTVSVEGMPELECVAPCMLEVPAGEPFALRFRKDGYADVREVVPSDPNRKTLELEIQAPTPSRPELKIRRIPRVR